MCFAPFIALAIFLESSLFAGILFVFVMLTDGIDGYLARKRNEVHRPHTKEPLSRNKIHGMVCFVWTYVPPFHGFSVQLANNPTSSPTKPAVIRSWPLPHVLGRAGHDRMGVLLAKFLSLVGPNKEG